MSFRWLERIPAPKMADYLMILFSQHRSSFFHPLQYFSYVLIFTGSRLNGTPIVAPYAFLLYNVGVLRGQ